MTQDQTSGGTTTTFAYFGTSFDPSAIITAGINTTFAISPQGPLAQRVGPAGTVNYLATNLHTDVVGLVADGTGVFSSPMAYDAWGAPRSGYTPGSPLGYQGDPTDPNTGLVNMQHRLYAPALGRFMTQDGVFGLLTNPSSLNQFIYGGDSPVGNTDPGGNCWVCLSTLITAITVIAIVVAVVVPVIAIGMAAYGAVSTMGIGMAALADTAMTLTVGTAVEAGGDLAAKDFIDSQAAAEAGAADAGAADAGAAEGAGGRGAGGMVGCETNSFPAETKVLLASGRTMPISSVHPGTQLASMALGNKATRLSRPVTATYSHFSNDLYRIKVGRGRIVSTAGHRFWVKGHGWTLVRNLSRGSSLLTVSGASARIGSIQRLHLRVRVYDLTVSTTHTFFVGPITLLVHNCGGGSGDRLYRNGGNTPNNVTPRERDAQDGLSTWNSPEAAGIEPGGKGISIDPSELERGGLRATQTGPPGHFSIRPPDDAEFAGWIASRSNGTFEDNKFTQFLGNIAEVFRRSV